LSRPAEAEKHCRSESQWHDRQVLHNSVHISCPYIAAGFDPRGLLCPSLGFRILDSETLTVPEGIVHVVFRILD
jgi:hypothetical protein